MSHDEHQELTAELTRSIRMIECTLPNGCALEALDRALTIAERLRSSGNPKLARVAAVSMTRCGRFTMACAKRELTDHTGRSDAQHWWLLGRKLAAGGWQLPEGFEDLLLTRTQKIYLRRTLDMLAASKHRSWAPSAYRNARKELTLVAGGTPPKNAGASARW
jgi:hypothetical protein